MIRIWFWSSKECWVSLSLSLFPAFPQICICVYEGPTSKSDVLLLCFDLLTRPKMPFKMMNRKEVTHSNGSYERKLRGRKLADEMGRARKIPMVHYWVMHRKRVTSELHDSYFRLMTIKHSISKIEWASNDYIIELSSTSQNGCQESLRQLETSCGREGHTRPRVPSGTPMEWTPASGEQERHNVTVITVGSKYCSYVRSPAPSHMQTLNNPFKTLQ